MFWWWGKLEEGQTHLSDSCLPLMVEVGCMSSIEYENAL